MHLAATTGAWHEKNCHLNILNAARKGRYGVIATVAYNIEHIILDLYELLSLSLTVDLTILPLGRDLFRRTSHPATVQISLHLDHAQDESLVKLAADTLSFDSIMVDMSHYGKAEILRKTAELVQHCADRGIATDAEPGRIEGGEDGVMDTGSLEAYFTTMKDVKNFVHAGVDGRELGLNLRLQEIDKALPNNVLIALHGTNGFTPQLMKECIQHGVVKINVNKLVLEDYLIYHCWDGKKHRLTSFMKQGTQKVIRPTVKWLEICGSAGKA
ncbi:hypothetical protein VI817_002799 [Penicillium citrinum]|nr:hypothetical protein VI817_002799 [Penicillium citrinum]